MNLRQEGARYEGNLTNHTADLLGGLQANPDPDPRLRGTNDQYDAFRHAYSSARATELSNGNAHIAKKLGDWSETQRIVRSFARNESYEVGVAQGIA
jgi:hypothetical protein